MLEDKDTYGVLGPQSSESDFICSDYWDNAEDGNGMFICSYVAVSTKFSKFSLFKNIIITLKGKEKNHENYL